MSKMRPRLKRIHSPDIHDLGSFQPEDGGNFAFLLQAMFGPEGTEGEESFDIVVCTPRWLEQNVSENVISGRHHVIVKRYDIEQIRAFLERYARDCEADTWQAVAAKLSRIGRWEFEDYTP